LVYYLRRQYIYNEWANREALSAIRAAGSDQRSLDLIAHILSAEQLWQERLKLQPPTSPVWPKSDLEQCEGQAVEMGLRWREYLNSLTSGDLMKTVSYNNSKGEPWASTIGDILTHVLMHSAYHRGQVASHMRDEGLNPAYTDFIHAVRTGLVK